MCVCVCLKKSRRTIPAEHKKFRRTIPVDIPVGQCKIGRNSGCPKPSGSAGTIPVENSLSLYTVLGVKNHSGSAGTIPVRPTGSIPVERGVRTLGRVDSAIILHLPWGLC